ncbi:MAG TPA: 50S ribosomal protein L4 [Firmicutes bacterium]|jgi:large subunit ribosomal protein L4|nr:50S ribosomal protein L4 [Bacillota bacterium]
MPTVDVLNMDGERIGELELNPVIFDADIKEHLLYDVVKMHQANRRRGTAATKDRSEVRGGGKKPWRQKGTGRARHGSIRSPIWRGGGVTFGPRPRSFKYLLPKKMRRAALYSALTSKVKKDQLIVLDSLQLTEAKTRNVVRLMNNLHVGGKALVVTAGSDLDVYLSCRNIPGIKSIVANQINVLDIMKYDQLIMTRDAVNVVEEVFAS